MKYQISSINYTTGYKTRLSDPHVSIFLWYHLFPRTVSLSDLVTCFKKIFMENFLSVNIFQVSVSHMRFIYSECDYYVVYQLDRL